MKGGEKKNSEKLVFGDEHNAVLVFNVRHSQLTFQFQSSTYRLYSRLPIPTCHSILLLFAGLPLDSVAVEHYLIHSLNKMRSKSDIVETMSAYLANRCSAVLLSVSQPFSDSLSLSVCLSPLKLTCRIVHLHSL